VNKPKVPETKFRIAAREQEIVRGLTEFFVLLLDSRALLIQERRLSQKVDQRAVIELNLARNILFQLCQLDPKAFESLSEEIRSGEGYSDRVRSHADAMVPPRRLIVTPEEYQRERGGLVSRRGGG
jgi:hypothetical protein